MNDRTVFMGTFDPEKFWRDEKAAKLPEIKDAASDNVVSAMDELLFPLCGKEDILLTKYRLEPVFEDFLQNAGFSFGANKRDLNDEDEGAAGSVEKCVFELLNKQIQNTYFLDLLKGISSIDTYAILPYTALACRNWGFMEMKPDFEIVKKVNSKIYSHNLCEKIGIAKYGAIINNSKELEKAAIKYENERGFLIKDPYGVSGKGNMVISTHTMLKKIEKYLSSQEEKGLFTRFLIEPYYDKVRDFSCQALIGQDGKHSVLSVQNTVNRNFSYSGSLGADRDFIDYLESRNYFDIVARAVLELAGEGYVGNLCIDSMIIKNDEVIPIVEINARKSMGLINHYLDKFLAPYSSGSYLSFFSTGYKSHIRFEDVLGGFKNGGMLFDPEKGSGMIPLSCNTLFINRKKGQTSGDGSVFKGKFYFSAAAGGQEERQFIVKTAKEILKDLCFTVYN